MTASATVTEFVSVPITVIESVPTTATALSVQSTTITVTERFTSLGADTTVVAPVTEKITAIETIVSLQTVTETAKATITEKGASMIIPTTIISREVLTEKMLPVTVHVTATSMQPGVGTTVIQRVSETATATITERMTLPANIGTPTTVTELCPTTLTKENAITVVSAYTTTLKTTAVTTATAISTMTASAKACPLQEKTITRFFTNTYTPKISVTVVSTTSTKPAVVIPTPPKTTPITSIKISTSKAPAETTSSSKSSMGSICPTPSPTSVILTSTGPSTTTAKTSTCTKGQKRCDIYDRRKYNECKVDYTWSDGIKMTDADNMQCEESTGSVKLVPIPAKLFHV